MAPQQPLSLWRASKQWLRDFVLPEKAVSMKLVFDNVRNYLMCAALVLAIQAVANPGNPQAEWPWALAAVVTILSALNLLQSWLLIGGTIESLRALPRVLQSRWSRGIVKLVLILFVLLALTAAFQVIPLLLVAIASGHR